MLSITPAVDLEKRSRQTRKLSWLTVYTGVYSKGEKNFTKDLTAPLAEESKALVAFYKENHGALSQSERYRLFSQLLIYLNRLLLFQPHSEPALIEWLEVISAPIKWTGDAKLKEDWLRERMILARLAGKEDEYQRSKEAYSTFLNGQPDRAKYANEAVALLDGLLSCASDHEADGNVSLAVAAKALPQGYTTHFFYSDFNALLFSRGRKCKPALTRLLEEH